MYYSKSHKHIQIGSSWLIDCVTVENNGNTTYEVNVIMADVPWLEEVHGVKNIQTKEEANKVFKEFAIKYKNL